MCDLVQLNGTHFVRVFSDYFHYHWIKNGKVQNSKPGSDGIMCIGLSTSITCRYYRYIAILHQFVKLLNMSDCRIFYLIYLYDYNFMEIQCVSLFWLNHCHPGDFGAYKYCYCFIIIKKKITCKPKIIK